MKKKMLNAEGPGEVSVFNEPIGATVAISAISISGGIYIAHKRKCNGWGYLGWIILCGIIAFPLHLGAAALNKKTSRN